MHVKWPSTRRFADVVKFMEVSNVPSMRFRPKIKLHGANAAIVFDGEKFQIQGRNHVITPEQGLFNILDELQMPTKGIISGKPFAIYGEWAGPGCAKNPDIISSIERKSFFVFAVAVFYGGITASHLSENYDVELFTDPDDIEPILQIVYGDEIPSNVYVLPWEHETVVVRAHASFYNKEIHENILNKVEKIGNLDPYVLDAFGLEGPGEGLVYFQDDAPQGKFPHIFKVKSERHDVVKRNHVKHEIVVPESVNAFLDAFVTTNRVKQIAHEQLGVDVDIRNAGKIIPAVIRDILSEGANEIESAGMDKDIGKHAPQSIRKIIFECMNDL